MQARQNSLIFTIFRLINFSYTFILSLLDFPTARLIIVFYMNRHAHLYAFSAAILFGLMSPVIKHLMTDAGTSGIVITTSRLTGAAILFWILSIFTPREKIDRKDYPYLILMALCGMVLNQYPIIIGLQYTAPSHATLAASLTPITALFLARVFFKEPIGWRRASGVLVAFLGVSTLIFASSSSGGRSSILGDALCLGSQFFATLYFVFFIRIIKKYNPITLLKYLFTIAAVIASPWVTDDMINYPWVSLSTVNIASLFYIVFFATFISYLLLIPAQKHLPASVVVIYNYVQPVIALCISVWLGLESFGYLSAIALGLIIVGVTIVTRRTVQSKSIPTSPHPPLERE